MKLHFYFELDQPQQEKWNHFWHSSPHSHARQHYAFGQIERAKGRIPLYIVGEVDGTWVCIALFSIRPLWFGKKLSCEAFSLQGPIFDDVTLAREFLLQLISHFKALTVGSLRISPHWSFPEALPVESMLGELGFLPHRLDYGTRRATGYVDLHRSEEEILASFSKSARREVRRAQRRQVTVRPAATLQEAEIFFKEHNAMHASRGFGTITPTEYRATFEYIFKDRQLGVILNAFSDSDYLGGLLAVRGPHVAHGSQFVVVPAALRKLSNLRIAPLVWFHAMTWARNLGCSSLDVVGYRPDMDRSSPLYEIFAYKKAFNPKPLEIIAQHIRVCNPAVHYLFRGSNRLLRWAKATKSIPYKISKRLAIRKVLRENH